MENNTIFTFIKRYRFILLGAFLLLTLTACGGSTEPIDENTSGFFNHYIVYNFSLLIKYFANLFNGSYGWSLVLMTIIIRLALMPLMLKQYKSQIEMREKMSVIQPEMQQIQEKYKGKKDPQSQQKMQQELMQLYQKHNFNPLSTFGGCLPIIIQLPILMGFYWAIIRTPEIAESSFLWFSLGERDFILPFLAAAVYFIQFKVSQIGVPVQPQQEQMMKTMGLITPIMMGAFSFSMAAALPLYWTVGGTFLIVQTLISKALYKQPNAETPAKAEK